MGTERTGIEQPVSQLNGSLQALLAFERFHLHGADAFRNAAEMTESDRRYLPENCEAIELPCYWVRRRQLYWYGNARGTSLGIDLPEQGDELERVLLPIHPLALEYYAPFLQKVRAQRVDSEEGRIWAVPTSSTRTLLAWPDNAPNRAVFVKTSLHSRVLGDRRISRNKVAGAIGLSRLIEQSSPVLPEDLRYLFETHGFIPRQLDFSGVIFREIPEAVRADEILLAPLFSLVGGNGAYRPLFLTMIERAGIPAHQFISEILCAKFARLWLDMSMRFGLILEAHGQDLMLALSKDLTPLGQFYYRDFEGLSVDWQLARKLPGLPSMPNEFSWYETYETWGHPHSQLVFWKLRTSLFDYLQLFLSDLESQVRGWQQRGLLGGPRVGSGDMTMEFSQHLWLRIDQMFNCRIAARYNIGHSLNKFVIFLMHLRRQAMSDALWPVVSRASVGQAVTQ